MVVKRWFTLVAVTGLAGFVAPLSTASCNDTTTEAAAVAPDSGTEPTNRHDASNATPQSDCPIALEYKQSDVDDTLKGTWHGPKPSPGACTGDELKTFAKNLSGADAKTTVDEIGAGLGASCKGCLFSTTGDSNWQLVVSVADGDPTAAFLNFGACHAVVNGADECGKSYQYNQFCTNAACGKCQSGDTPTCVEAVAAQGGACEALDKAVQDSCTRFSASQAKCTNGAAGHAAVLCGAPLSDAGADPTDAAADADAN